MKYDISLINTNFRFSLFPNLYNTKPISEIDINALIEIIKYGYLSTEVEDLRKTISVDDYKEIKKQLPAVTVSGLFKVRNLEGLVKHSGLIQIDIDKVADYDNLFNKLCNDTYTYLCFKSPGGKGIKIIVKIFQSINTHAFQANSLVSYYKEKYDIEIDSQCKDIPRLMLLSYDPDIFCNPYSKIYAEQLILTTEINSQIKQTDTTKNPSVKNFKGNEDVILNIIDRIEASKIDITGSYKDWLSIGFALCNEYGENGRAYFHKISSYYPYYNPKETDKQYSDCVKNNNGKTTIGTLIFIGNKILPNF
jgi:hypothetical protein